LNREDFRAPSAGILIEAAGGHLALMTAPLPPDLVYDADLVLALSRADAALGELSGLVRWMGSHLLIAPYLRREAVLSSRIEGIKVSLYDLLLAEVEDERSADTDLKEVRQCVEALEHGIERLRELPVSLRLVCELHERLMRGVRGGHATPGELRSWQNWIGLPGSTLATAPYVPPPPERLKETLSNWELFLQDRGRFPDLIQCALMHEQFEAIHPFLNGNGRVGRLLIPLFLIERGRLSQPVLYLSAYFEARRREYYEALQRVRTDGDWTGWLRFFLAGVEETAREAVSQAGRIMDLHESFRRRLCQKPNAVALLDGLFANLFVTVSRAARLLNVSYPTARQTVAYLQGEGLLEEITGRAWGRLYLARTILEMFEGR
jgi:Fic family protein